MMEQTSLNIGTIGQKLEAARRAKGLSVSEAGRATKILSKFIEAMESDDFGALSAPVYAKSFLRMYAQYLGLDARPLVDEYVAQHAPLAKPQMTEEVRQSLSKVEQPPMDDSALSHGGGGGGRKIFSSVGESFGQMSGNGIPLKAVWGVLAAVLLLGIVVLSATQCAGDEEKAPAAAGGAASVEREVIKDGVPDAYLVKPGVVETE